LSMVATNSADFRKFNRSGCGEQNLPASLSKY
ncbi:MAG: hypothetical protein ACI892_002221, partial [Marinobacter maritimus]